MGLPRGPCHSHRSARGYTALGLLNICRHTLRTPQCGRLARALCRLKPYVPAGAGRSNSCAATPEHQLVKVKDLALSLPANVAQDQPDHQSDVVGLDLGIDVLLELFKNGPSARYCAEAIQSISISNTRQCSGDAYLVSPIKAGKAGNVCPVVNRTRKIVEINLP